ncbi:MAG TPA: hypothetical protein VGM95_01580 [Lactobacillaceae bacterium]|jgi:hypothetical protein
MNNDIIRSTWHKEELDTISKRYRDFQRHYAGLENTWNLFVMIAFSVAWLIVDQNLWLLKDHPIQWLLLLPYAIVPILLVIFGIKNIGNLNLMYENETTTYIFNINDWQNKLLTGALILDNQYLILYVQSDLTNRFGREAIILHKEDNVVAFDELDYYLKIRAQEKKFKYISNVRSVK